MYCVYMPGSDCDGCGRCQDQEDKNDSFYDLADDYYEEEDYFDE